MLRPSPGKELWLPQQGKLLVAHSLSRLLATHHVWLNVCLMGQKCWPGAPSVVLHTDTSTPPVPCRLCKVPKSFHTV